MKTIQKLSLLFGALALVSASMFNVACSSSDDNDDLPTVKLEPSKSTVNVGESVTFTVTYDGANVTSQATITNVTDNKPVESATFTPTEAKAYEFTATYDGKTSGKIKVTVNASGLQLSVEPTGDITVGESATFKVLLEGNDVTAEAEITNVTDNTTVESATFTPTKAGTFEFTAEYEGETSNTISIEVVEGTSGEFYYHNITSIRITGTACGPCSSYYRYVMDENVTPAFGERIVEILAHTNIQGGAADPYIFSGSGAIATYISQRIGKPAGGVPFGTFDYATDMTGNAPSSITTWGEVGKHIVDNVMPEILERDATTGFKFESSIEGDEAKVSVTVASTGNSTEYSLVVALVEDNLVGTQQGLGAFTHHNALRAMATNISGESLGVVGKDSPVTKEYTVKLSAGWDTANLKWVAFATSKEGTKITIDNSAYGAIDGVTNFKYEE